MNIKKNLVRGALLIVLLFALYPTIKAQDTEYWFVAPHLDDWRTGGTSDLSYFDRPVFFMITTGADPATVTMSQPANSGFADVTLTIPANSSQRIEYTTSVQIAAISNDIRNAAKVGIKDNKGILFKATAPVTIFYEVNSVYSKDIFSLKGAKALGKEFYTPFQKKYLSTASYKYAYAQFHIVATEDNTTVSIKPTANIVGTNAGDTKTVTLNKGETFAARARDFMQAARLDGSRIVSDKPVAVTVCDDLISSGGGADVVGDQIVPVNNIGTNYVVIRGYTTNAYGDYVYVMGVQDGTNVYFNGSATPAATVNAGQSYEFQLPESENARFITTSKPAYVFQLSGVGGEMGAVLLPSMYSINSRRIAFYKDNPGSHYLFLLVRSGNEGAFLVNGSATTVTAASFQTVTALPDWKYAKVDITSLPNGNCVVENTKGTFALGYFFGSGSASFGYLSHFGQLQLPDTTYKCANQAITIDAGYAKQYKWWKGKKEDEPSVGIATSSTYTVPANQTGYYTVWADQDPFDVYSTTYVAIDTFKIKPAIPQFVQKGVSQNLAVSVKRNEGKTYAWTIAGSTPASAATASTPAVWNATGEYNVSIKVQQSWLRFHVQPKSCNLRY